jgi:hypothetical protein
VSKETYYSVKRDLLQYHGGAETIRERRRNCCGTCLKSNSKMSFPVCVFAGELMGVEFLKHTHTHTHTQ